MASSHLRALLLKNFILWRRNWLFSLLEIFIPAFFALLFYAFRTASPLTYFPETTYSGSPVTLFGQPGTFSVLKKCTDIETGGFVALAPADDWIVTKLAAIFTSKIFLFFYKKVSTCQYRNSIVTTILMNL